MNTIVLIVSVIVGAQSFDHEARFASMAECRAAGAEALEALEEYEDVDIHGHAPVHAASFECDDGFPV